jgi:hypothetical protein
MYEEFMHEEAVDWFETNFNPSALASGRFDSTADALDFVRVLYGAGAKKVSVINVLNEPWRLLEEGGPYADTLVALLPAEPDKRAAVTDIYMEEVTMRGCNEGDAESGIKKDCLVFWWD